MEIPAAEFRVRFFELLDEIAARNEEVVITKHGRPIVRITSAAKKSRAPFGCMRGTGRIMGDIETAVLPSIDEWGLDK